MSKLTSLGFDFTIRQLELGEHFSCTNSPLVWFFVAAAVRKAIKHMEPSDIGCIMLKIWVKSVEEQLEQISPLAVAELKEINKDAPKL